LIHRSNGVLDRIPTEGYIPNDVGRDDDSCAVVKGLSPGPIEKLDPTDAQQDAGNEEGKPQKKADEVVK
jgi:hypothetical protein